MRKDFLVLVVPETELWIGLLDSPHFCEITITFSTNGKTAIIAFPSPTH